VAECRRCPWWTDCGPELLASADISLLLSGADVDVARAAGIGTIPELADLDGAAAQCLPFTVAQAGSAQIRARAWCLGAVLVRTDPRSAIRRADVELDIDAESYGEDGAYLWGTQLSGADVGLPPGYRSFVTWQHLPSPTQGEVFGQFFGYLMQVRHEAAKRGLSFAVYCYARAAEERWMLGLARRYSGLPGVPDPRAVAAFCASPQWVDLLLEIKRQFVATGSLRLKELAKAIGYSWRDPEPGGENSMAWYRAAVDAGSAHPMAARVVRYNEDDVLATLAVRRWITEHLDELPTVGDLS
jgi:predicted RecB family nuclease